DQEIIEHLRQGGKERRRGEEQLFGRYSYFIREGMSKHALSEDDSFSAYSDSVLSAIEKIVNHSFEGRSSLKTYLYQIFHNKCVDLLRKKSTNKSSVHRTESMTDMLLYVSDSAKSVVQNLIDKSDWNLLKQKLAELGENCRQLLGLWSDSYSDKEIAAAIGYKTADVVKTSRLRCLEKLRQLYRPT
ncbi:MAG: RNA polymerase sigma factor, partial [Chitinophagales bacterium]